MSEYWHGILIGATLGGLGTLTVRYLWYRAKRWDMERDMDRVFGYTAPDPNSRVKTKLAPPVPPGIMKTSAIPPVHLVRILQDPKSRS